MRAPAWCFLVVSAIWLKYVLTIFSRLGDQAQTEEAPKNRRGGRMIGISPHAPHRSPPNLSLALLGWSMARLLWPFSPLPAPSRSPARGNYLFRCLPDVPANPPTRAEGLSTWQSPPQYVLHQKTRDPLFPTDVRGERGVGRACRFKTQHGDPSAPMKVAGPSHRPLPICELEGTPPKKKTVSAISNRVGGAFGGQINFSAGLTFVSAFASSTIPRRQLRDFCTRALQSPNNAVPQILPAAGRGGRGWPSPLQAWAPFSLRSTQPGFGMCAVRGLHFAIKTWHPSCPRDMCDTDAPKCS